MAGLGAAGYPVDRQLEVLRASRIAEQADATTVGREFTLQEGERGFGAVQGCAVDVGGTAWPVRLGVAVRQRHETVGGQQGATAVVPAREPAIAAVKADHPAARRAVVRPVDGFTAWRRGTADRDGHAQLSRRAADVSTGPAEPASGVLRSDLGTARSGCLPSSGPSKTSRVRCPGAPLIIGPPADQDLEWGTRISKAGIVRSSLTRTVWRSNPLSASLCRFLTSDEAESVLKSDLR